MLGGKDSRIFSLSWPALAIYLLACILLSAFALSSFAHIIQRFLAVPYSFQTELVMVTGQVAFQWLFMLPSTWIEKKQYAIVALSVSMIGSLFLLPLICLNIVFAVPALIAAGYFFVVVIAIWMIHQQLIQELALPKRLTATWLVYRLFLLLYVLLPRETK